MPEVWDIGTMEMVASQYPLRPGKIVIEFRRSVISIEHTNCRICGVHVLPVSCKSRNQLEDHVLMSHRPGDRRQLLPRRWRAYTIRPDK